MNRVEYLPSLTGLRGVMALWVMLAHFAGLEGGMGLGIADLRGWSVFHLGVYRVDVFFMLSGFMLMWIHGETCAQLDLRIVGKFMARRLIRIYPPFLVVLLATVIVVGLVPKFGAEMFDEVARAQPLIAFVRNLVLGTQWLPGDGILIASTWSLSAEILGYALFPLMAIAGLRTRTSSSAFACAAVSFAVLFAYQCGHDLLGHNDLSKGGSLMRMGCEVFVGVMLARARHLATPELAARASSGSIVVVAVGVGLFVLNSWKAGYLLTELFALLIFCLSFSRGPVHRALTAAPSLLLGKLSFAIYLVHWPILWLLRTFFHEDGVPTPGKQWLFLAVFVLLTLALARMLHVYVEVPAQRYRFSPAGRFAAGNRTLA